MDYEGLTKDDLANVTALNRAWLDLNGRRAEPRRLSLVSIERLAATPFLLFSCQEQDDALWQRLLGDERQPDLIDTGPGRDVDLLGLQGAGLAFLWDLARRNPYVARVVSGATLSWCDRLAARTLADLLGRVGRCLIIRGRFDEQDSRFQRLLESGTGIDGVLREAAQLGVLQSLLTLGHDARYGRLPAAACELRHPHRKVADEV